MPLLKKDISSCIFAVSISSMPHLLGSSQEVQHQHIQDQPIVSVQILLPKIFSKQGSCSTKLVKWIFRILLS